jgi:hypothetical protein
MQERSAAVRYKEVLEGVTEAAGKLREQDRERAEGLRRRLIGLEDEMLRSAERARLTASIVQLHWDNTLDLLWAESWMKLRPRPAPDPGADPAQLEALDAEVHRRADALRAVVRRRWYQFPRS